MARSRSRSGEPQDAQRAGTRPESREYARSLRPALSLCCSSSPGLSAGARSCVTHAVARHAHPGPPLHAPALFSASHAAPM